MRSKEVKKKRAGEDDYIAENMALAVYNYRKARRKGQKDALLIPAEDFIQENLIGILQAYRQHDGRPSKSVFFWWKMKGEITKTMLHREDEAFLVSLQDPICADSDNTLEDIIPLDGGLGRQYKPGPNVLAMLHLEAEKMTTLLKNRIGKLANPKNRQVLSARLGFEGRQFTLDEISRKFGITKERVRQIEKEACAEIQKKLKTSFPIPENKPHRWLIEIMSYIIDLDIKHEWGMFSRVKT